MSGRRHDLAPPIQARAAGSHAAFGHLAGGWRAGGPALHDTSDTTSSASGSPRLDHASRSPLRVLLVDDDPVLLGISARNLRRWCVSVQLAASQHDAYLILRSSLDAPSALDAVVCDGLEGDWVEVYELAASIGLPFVLLTGDPRKVALARTRGVPAYLRDGRGWMPHVRAALAGLPGTWPPADLAAELAASRAS